MPSFQIAPSILTADFGRLAEQIQAADADGADLFHIDIMDGRFVPALSFGPLIVDAVRRATDKRLDVHLMILEPERVLEDYARAGAHRLTVHWEASPHLHRTLGAIRALGLKAGVALNPHTPIEGLRDVLEMADLVLIMSVNPGFGGQQFIPQALDRIARLRALMAEVGQHAEIIVDGGVNTESAAGVVKAGADTLVVGSALYREHDFVPHSITQLRERIGRALSV